MTLGRCLDFPEPQFAHLPNGSNEELIHYHKCSVSQGPGRHVGQPENSSDGRPGGALVLGASSRVDVPSSLSWPRMGDTAWALEEAPDCLGGGDISRGSQRKCAHRV